MRWVRLPALLPTIVLSAALLAIVSCDTGRDFGADTVEITVFVAYIPAAAARAGDIEREIRTAIRQTNEVYANSRVDVRLRAVQIAGVDYVVTDRFLDLKRLVTPGDGHLDELDAWRDDLDADVVVLVPDRRESTTNAAVLAEASTAFAIVHWEHLGAPSYALATRWAICREPATRRRTTHGRSPSRTATAFVATT